MATPSNTTFGYNFQNFIAYPTFDNYQDVVFSVNWLYNASYVDPTSGQQYTAERQRITQVNTNNITTFIPYDQLTKEIVIGWVNAGEDMSLLQQELVTDINNQINPPPPAIVVLPPPFSQ